MLRPVEIPLWALTLILAFAAVTFASHFLFPSVRWFLRRRAERLLSRLNERLDRPIDLFRLAHRQDMIARLVYDPKVMEAVTDHARDTGVPAEVAFEEARRYAREIVPGFSATLYFSVAIRLAKWISRGLYRVRIGKIDAQLGRIPAGATVVFVINHRSNMDYILVTWLVSGRTTLSYAVGEWARVWPLSRLIRAMGAYFIRRNSRNTLYRRVLARHVQMATADGTTQAIFPEGGLSLTGEVGAAKMGILSYIASAPLAEGRDVVFVPVGLAYDRVLEDRILTEAAATGTRRFRAPLPEIAAFVLRQIWRRLRGRFRGFGTAAASFGQPVSLNAFRAAHPGAGPEELGAHLMAAIEAAIPVLPVPLVAAALTMPGEGPLATRVEWILSHLGEGRAVLKLAPQGLIQTLNEGLAPLVARGIVSADHQPAAGEEAARLLRFYAAPVLQRMAAAAQGVGDAAARQ